MSEENKIGALGSGENPEVRALIEAAAQIKNLSNGPQGASALSEAVREQLKRAGFGESSIKGLVSEIQSLIRSANNVVSDDNSIIVQFKITKRKNSQ